VVDAFDGKILWIVHHRLQIAVLQKYDYLREYQRLKKKRWKIVISVSKMSDSRRYYFFVEFVLLDDFVVPAVALVILLGLAVLF
jgi:hypothetical protein